MLEPLSPLPWIKDGNYGITQSNKFHSQVVVSEVGESGGFVYNADLDYTIEAVNNYSKLVELIRDIDKSLYLGEDLKDSEILSWYMEVVKTCKEDISEFLKEIDKV